MTAKTNCKTVNTRKGFAGTVTGTPEDGYRWECHRGHRSADTWPTLKEAAQALGFHADEGPAGQCRTDD